MNPHIASGTSNHTAHCSPREALALRIWRHLLVVAMFISRPEHVHAQQPVIDTTTISPGQSVEHARLGARFVLGGIYAYGGHAVHDSSDVHPTYYGVRAGALIPVGANFDLMVAGEFLKFPGWSYTTYTNVSNPYLWGSIPEMEARPTKVLNSKLAGARFGFRVYARSVKSDAWWLQCGSFSGNSGGNALIAAASMWAFAQAL